jgi:hypothetical protein
MRLTMLKTVEGFYRDGKIELAEMPGAAPEASPVLVTFLDPNQVNVVQLREYLEQLEAIQGIQQGLAGNVLDLWMSNNGGSCVLALI